MYTSNHSKVDGANYTLYKGDCIEILKTFKKGDIDIVITDPPYLHEKGGRGKFLLGTSLDREGYNMGKLSDFGESKIVEFLDITKSLMVKPQWYIFCSEKQLVYYLKWAVENKLKYNVLTWNKPVNVLNRERYSTNIEYIVRIYSKGCALNKLDLDANKDKVKYYSKYKTYNVIKGKGKLHGSQKPVDLINELVELSTEEGAVVLDCYMGSGSTIESAIKKGRKAIGIEIEESIFNISSDRLKGVIVDG